ncbi:MAG: 1,4-dihydroxy-2-naphthoate polyprenyltransferase [Deltaproteobacteria bacterium]|nr:1,4-dihydroxy-2-naphthoate polyprenyltransferase [Deltaproteobacteria bacterium]
MKTGHALATASSVERSSPTGTFGAWVLACRPATLAAGVVPVLVGSACATALGGFRVGPAAAALLGALLIQIGTNLANDLFDFEKGADTQERLGPTRAVAAGLLSKRAVGIGAATAFALATACGVYLTAVAGPVVVVIGLASIVSGVAYTAGPHPLAYVGLGDVFVIVFFGFVAVAGTAFVQLGYVPAIAWWAGGAVGALATAILAVNNLRDRITDTKAGKRTLAVRFGRRFAIGEYLALVGVAYAVPVGMWMVGGFGRAVLLPIVTLPLGIGLAREVVTGEGRALNQTLVGTARLLVAHGILMASGIALGGASCAG